VSLEADSPAQLLQAARDLLAQSGQTVGLWPRAAAFLGRQALEAALIDLWTNQASGLEHASFRTQLLCVRSFLGNDALAGRVNHAWWALTRVCHYHPYELSPNWDELSGWFQTIDELSAEVQAIIERSNARSTQVGRSAGA
jgi:hypothetical protein